MAQPGTAMNWPSGMPGPLCMPNMASQGNRSRKPSSSILRAPPRPSSAGWNTACTMPSKWRVAARWRAADNSMAVWPSWPQACILPNTLLDQALPEVSAIGRASMSARRPMRRVLVPARKVPTTPVPPRPRCTSQPQRSSRAATRSLVSFSSNPSSGLAWIWWRMSTISAS